MAYFLGKDIGSAASKAVIVTDDGRVLGMGLAHGGAGTDGPGESVLLALEDACISPDDISLTAATGYGRNLAEDADIRLSELSCHALGAHVLCPEARTVIDIGGQDAKILRIGDRGRLASFVMNDKCAAGSGRFLENIARVLAADVGELSKLAEEAFHFEDIADALGGEYPKSSISSTCAVFAESEVISSLAHGEDKRNICAAIVRSVASRVAGLAQRAGIEPAVVMTGGVARSEAVRRALETTIGFTVTAPALAQYAGALGAAITAAGRYHETG